MRNDTWLGVLLAFVVTLVMMTAFSHFVLNFGEANAVGFSLTWAVFIAGRVAWKRQH